MLRPVDMRTELATLFPEFADTGELEHLKSSRVGKDRAIPPAESMQTASLVQNVKSGTEVEVIGVAEDNLRLHLLAQYGEMHTFHTAACSHGHEDRGENLPMVGGYHSRTGVGRIVSML